MSNALFPRLTVGFQCNVTAAILFIYICDVIFMGDNSSTNQQTQKVIRRWIIGLFTAGVNFKGYSSILAIEWKLIELFHVKW